MPPAPRRHRRIRMVHNYSRRRNLSEATRTGRSFMASTKPATFDEVTRIPLDILTGSRAELKINAVMNIYSRGRGESCRIRDRVEGGPSAAIAAANGCEPAGLQPAGHCHQNPPQRDRNDRASETWAYRRGPVCSGRSCDT